MKEIIFIIPKGMDKHTWMFYDNCRFWHSMGVQKEDNVIALALADMNLACRIPYRIDDWKSYYKEIYERIIIEIKNPKYDERRGLNDFLLGSGL